jgi:hypothetical protein
MPIPHGLTIVFYPLGFVFLLLLISRWGSHSFMLLSPMDLQITMSNSVSSEESKMSPEITATVDPSVKIAKTKNGDVVLVPQPSDDPEDPLVSASLTVDNHREINVSNRYAELAAA